MQLTPNSTALWHIPPMVAADHKYTRGHVGVVGGAVMTGAARLAALAAQRAGAGMVSIAAPMEAWPIYAASLMSVITLPLRDTAELAVLARTRKWSVWLLGPGCAPEAMHEPLRIACESGLPMVLDAGALATLATDAALRRMLAGKPFALLPHEGEYKALAQACGLDVSAPKPERARALAHALGGVVLLKGADTYIAAPDGRVVHHASDTPWLATAGTGDVLAGMVAGLAAQGMALFDACCAGAWLHTEAAHAHGVGMVPEDLLPSIAEVRRGL